MTHFQSLFDKTYLGSWDLPDGKEVTVTIESVSGVQLVATGNKKNKKPVIKFVGKDKKFVCNVTNSKTIAAMYGVHVEEWAGKQITLYKSTTRDPSTGSDIDCLRVRQKAPSGKSAAPAAASETI